MNDMGVPAADRIVTQRDNLPPLDGEALNTETADLQARAIRLADSATRAECRDEETAQRSVLLVGMIKDQLKAIDSARTVRKAPYLEAGRAIDAHYNGIAGLLVTTDTKGRPIGGPLHTVMQMIDEYRRECERKAEEERRRLEEEARKAREAAEAAERARIEAEIADAPEDARDAAVRALDAEVAAERFERQAVATQAMPVQTAYGVSAGRRTVYRVEITDLRKATQMALRINPNAVMAAVKTIFEQQVRAGIRTYPDSAGVRIIEDSQTVVRAR